MSKSSIIHQAVATTAVVLAFLAASCSKDANPTDKKVDDTPANIAEINVILKCKIDGVQKIFATDVTAFRYSAAVMTDISGYSDSTKRESILVQFQAADTGTYYDNYHGVPHIEYWIGDSVYASNMISVMHDDSARIAVVKYGAIGDSLCGTFSSLVGDGNYTGGPAERQITEGEFRVLRQNNME